MGVRTVKYGVNEQQLQHSRESGPGQMATRSSSQMRRANQPCHACAGMRDGASMAAAPKNLPILL